jgi:hypothetical protein
MERSMKKLILVALLLVLPRAAWAQSYDSIGYPYFDNLNTASGGADSTPAWNFQDVVDSNLVYTATTGDSVLVLHAYGDTGDSIQVAVWKWSSSTPTDSFRTGLVVIGSGGPKWDSTVLSTKWGLVDGQKYSYAICPLNSTDYYEFSAWNPTGDDAKVLTTTDGFPASYSSDDFWSGIISAWVLVRQYGVSSDTCSVGHTGVAVDTNFTSIVIQDTYTENATSIDSFSVIWDDDTNPADPLGRVSDLTGLVSPDTLTVTGLDTCVTYYFWPIVTPDGCAPDTGSIITVPTLCPTRRVTIIGAGGP